ncbi:MAG: DciA family protein [bacterium]|nr:DciA family protein [bacterium]
MKVEEALKGLLPPEVQMVSFKEGRLILNVPSASYASDIYLRSREIKKKINESLKSKVVSEIRFRNQS